MKVGVIGFGYWGKIIHKTLKKNYPDHTILIHDPVHDLNEPDIFSVDKAFIATPASTHFEVCTQFIDKKIDIFCEKPLDTSSERVKLLYERADKNDCDLFVDWVFCYTDIIKKIKDDYISGSLGKIKNVILKRLNNGPIRYDVSSKYDLACHDVSIIQHIFSEKCIQSNWIEFKKDYNASQNGTVVGYLKYEFFDSFIMGSWEHYEKTRDFIFNFEKKQVIWDDNNKKVKYVSKDGIEVFDFLKDSSLDNSIQTFMSGNKSDLKYNRKITHDVTNIINN